MVGGLGQTGDLRRQCERIAIAAQLGTLVYLAFLASVVGRTQRHCTWVIWSTATAVSLTVVQEMQLEMMSGSETEIATMEHGT